MITLDSPENTYSNQQVRTPPARPASDQKEVIVRKVSALALSHGDVPAR